MENVYLRLNSELNMAHSKSHAKALELFDQGKLEEALSQFNTAIEEEMENATLHHDRAICYFNLKKFPAAIVDLDIAVRLEPQRSYRYSSRAFVKGAMKDVHGAISDYEKAIELDPEDAIAYNNLGLLQEQLGYMKEAKEQYAVADELAGILKDNQVDKSKAELPPEQAPESSPEEAKTGDYIREILKVFHSKKAWKEYTNFIKQGFKRKNDQ